MERWHRLSPDPNSDVAHRFRDSTLSRARNAPVANRREYLQSLARSKRVLDVGVVDHDAVKEGGEQWLHRSIASVATYCLGIDVLEDEVKKLQAAGYNVRVGDVTTEHFDEQFDLMVVGEVIEHLNCPGKLFEAATRVLLPGGVLAITTPNPYYLARVRRKLADLRTDPDNVDHVALFVPSGIAEMAERVGLRLHRFRGVELDRSQAARTFKGKLAFRFRGVLERFLLGPEALCDTIVYECMKPTTS